MNDDLKKIEDFHGHLGPYAVIGYKMGKIASEKLGGNPFDKSAIVLTGTTPPLSCIIDGIQIGSGCTLGKGNIKVHSANCAQVIFSNKEGNQIKITLKEKIRKEIETNVTEENIIFYANDIYSRSENLLFNIE
jgi:formylmethanofuran dehydrogenase subunit E